MRPKRPRPPVRLSLVVCVLGAAPGLGPVAAQSRPAENAPPPVRPNANALSPEVALAEGTYAEEILRDPAAAAPWYRRVRDDPRATLGDRQRATVRLARCQRLLNRPDTARVLLTDLLREPALAAETRSEALLELRRMPAVEPARLMPEDTLVYIELRDPGRLLRELEATLTRAGLDELIRQRLIGLLRRAFLTDISKSLNRSVLTDLGRFEGVGFGLHNVRFEAVAESMQMRADVLFVVYTGDIVATTLAFPWVLAGVLKPDAVLDGVQFYTPGSAAPDLHFAFEEGLVVLCSDMRAGADAVLRHFGRRRGGTLYGVPEFQLRPAGLDAPDTLGFFIDWPRLVDLAVRHAPDARREDADIIVDMLSLRQIGPIFGTLNIRDDRGELELAANVRSTDALLYRLCHTAPLQPGWRRLIPDRAIFGFATGLTPGDRRWRDFERLIVELRRGQRLAGVGAAATQPTDPLAGLRRFEEAAQLSIAEDVCRSINGLGIVLLERSAAPTSEGALPDLVIVLDVDQADAWRRRIERGLRRWILGPLSEAPLPTAAIDTPVGVVEQLSLPWTRIGPAWQVQGRRVVLAFSVDTLVTYLQRQAVEPVSPVASLRGQTENKFVTLRVDELLRLYYQLPPPAAEAAAPIRPQSLMLRTFERDNRIRVVVEQSDLAAAMRAVADVELARP